MKSLLTFMPLTSQKDWLKYGLLSSVFAFLVGLYGYTVSIAAEHIYFFIPAPIAAFVVNSLIWQWTFKKKDDYKIGNVISVGLIGIPIIHYFTFVLLGFGRIICCKLTGNCIDFMGKPESILSVFSTSFIQSFISIYKLGIITLPLGTLIGIYVMKKSKLTNIEIKTEI